MNKSKHQPTSPKKEEAVKKPSPLDFTKESTNSIKLIVTPKIIRYEPNHKGNFVGHIREWTHSVSYGGKTYSQGETFECKELKVANRFKQIGVCQEANGKNDPFDPQAPDKEFNLGDKVVKKGGNIKGAWEDDETY